MHRDFRASVLCFHNSQDAGVTRRGTVRGTAEEVNLKPSAPSLHTV